MEDYQKLIALYKNHKDGKSEKELAVLERQIWQAALPTINRTDGSLLSKREWLSKELEETPYAIEGRSTLLGYGDVADVLWLRIRDEKLPLRTATKLMREAKQKASMLGVEVAAALTKTLEEYDSFPAALLPDGSVIHKRNPSAPPRIVVPPPPAPVVEEVQETGKDDDPKLFWANLRGMISGYFHARLEGVDPGMIEKTYREFEGELRVILEHYQHKLDRMRRTSESQRRGMNRGKIIQACHVLHLDPPLGGRISEDFKKKAKKQYKTLAAKYHPDSSGTDDTREMYESVVEAYQILEDL